MLKKTISLNATVPDDLNKARLDKALSRLFPDYSRTLIKTWVEKNQVWVNGLEKRPKDPVFTGDQIVVETILEEQTEGAAAQAIALHIVYEDDDILVIDKPVGLVVHPAAGHREGTLLNALLYHAPELKHIPRAGIVHRLDKDTSGLLVIAKTLAAHQSLILQLQTRTMGRTYDAVVEGELISGGTIDAPIGRHHIHRQQMSITESGKSAITHYRVYKRYRGFTHLKVKLESGRTHQIRVHLSSRQHPVVGDRTYARGVRFPKESSPELKKTLLAFSHQALHASELTLIHPATQEEKTFTSALPADFVALLTALPQK